jgi:hypothetical protein
MIFYECEVYKFVNGEKTCVVWRSCVKRTIDWYVNEFEKSEYVKLNNIRGVKYRFKLKSVRQFVFYVFIDYIKYL